MNKGIVLIKMSECNRTDFLKVPFEDQSFPQKVFSAVWEFESEVYNGGIKQFFWNSSEGVAPFVIEAYNSICANQTAAICERAFALIFPSGLPEHKQICETMETLPMEKYDALQLLTYEYFQCPEDLDELLYQFVLDHPVEFGPPLFPEA